MSAYRFAPAHPGTFAYAYHGGPALASGDVVEMTDAQRDRLVGIIPGVDGGPCLVLVEPAAPPVAPPVSAPGAMLPEPAKRARKVRA